MAPPREAPENLPSVISATDSPSPLPTMRLVGESISGIPGAPFGPSFLMTTTSPATIFPDVMASAASFSPSKTLAVPVNCIILGLTAACLMTEPSGAMLPLRTAIPPCWWKGLSSGLRTSSSLTLAASAIWYTVVPFPVGVSARLSLRTFRIAGTPPALSRSLMA